MHKGLKSLDSKEFDLPETLFIRDIETRVFQSIIATCLCAIDNIALVEGNLIDSLLGRDAIDKAGIHVEQDQKSHSVKVKVEVNVAYGVSIPEKAEEIQLKITQEISKLTGLHVAAVHAVFKNLIPKMAQAAEKNERGLATGAAVRYTEEF